jgi:hypothetical protein
MLLLQQDLATNKVRSFIRREIWDAMKRAGLISESRRFQAPNHKTPTLRLVEANENDVSDDQDGSN